MLYDGINLDEGTEIHNTTVASGVVDFPAQPNVGELFFKITPAADRGLYIHDGTRWNKLALNSEISIPNGPTFPLSPSTGDVFYLDSNDSSESLYFWNGTTWVQTGGSGGSAGPAQSFSGETFPPTAVVGHTFYLTSDPGGLHVLTPTGWERIKTAKEIVESATTFTAYRFRAVDQQKIFSGADLSGKTLSFANTSILVFANGASLQDLVDYTLTPGANAVVTLSHPREADDEITIIVFSIPTTPPNSSLSLFEFASNSGEIQTAWANKFIRLEVGTAIGQPFLQLILPTITSNNIAIGSKIEIQNATGIRVDFIAGDSVYFETATTTSTTTSKFGVTTLLKVTPNNWSIYGNLQ